jgi:hypothetical protein
MNAHLVDIFTGMFYVAVWTKLILPNMKEIGVDFKRIVCGLWNGSEIDL